MRRGRGLGADDYAAKRPSPIPSTAARRSTREELTFPPMSSAISCRASVAGQGGCSGWPLISSPWWRLRPARRKGATYPAARSMALVPWLHTLAGKQERTPQAQGLCPVLQVPDDPTAVAADEVFLSGVISHLLDNAIKFTRPRSRQACVRAGVFARRVWIDVGDDGVGIPSEELLSPFYLSHPIDRQKRCQRGTGCGLATCKGQVEMHGSTVGARAGRWGTIAPAASGCRLRAERNQLRTSATARPWAKSASTAAGSGPSA